MKGRLKSVVSSTSERVLSSNHTILLSNSSITRKTGITALDLVELPTHKVVDVSLRSFEDVVLVSGLSPVKTDTFYSIHSRIVRNMSSCFSLYAPPRDTLSQGMLTRSGHQVPWCAQCFMANPVIEKGAFFAATSCAPFCCDTDEGDALVSNYFQQDEDVRQIFF